MASIKVKFRPSSVDQKEGYIYYQIIQNRVIRRLKTDYRLFSYEWDKETATIISAQSDRNNYLQFIKERIDWDVERFKSVIYLLDNKHIKYSVSDVIALYDNLNGIKSLFPFMQKVITQLKQMGKTRTSETYIATLRSFMRFRNDNDILLTEIDSELMLMYEAYLHRIGLTKNTTSFYMRILRAVYNRAVENELTANQYPFKHVYTGIDKTIKRAIPLEIIKQIKNLDLSLHPSLDFARDMFLFSFYTRGMSFIDMAFLKKKDLANGILSYRRRKTGQQLSIRWEQCMQTLVDKYNIESSEYLLPIIKPIKNNERTQYKNAMYLINRKLKTIGNMLTAQIPLTMYVARHSWASIAKSKNIPISVISEAMGHDSELTTQIYLASLETKVVDNANSEILNLLLDV